MDLSIQTRRTPPRLEFWFDFGSNYSYLSAMRIEEAASARGIDLVWKPFLLGPIFKGLGWESSPFLQQQEKLRYVWQDMARRCRKYGLPWRQPSTFPRQAVLPLRVALLAGGEPWQAEFCRRIMSLNCGQDRDIHTPEVVGEVLSSLGLAEQEILAAAQTDENKLRLRRQTEDARLRGIFGAPTFFVGEEMFWGDDRLDDALDWAADLRQPEGAAHV